MELQHVTLNSPPGRPQIRAYSGDVRRRLAAEQIPAAGAVWGRTWARDERVAEMLRGNLRTAGIPYLANWPIGPEYVDFHALRHSDLAILGKLLTGEPSKKWSVTAANLAV